MFSSSFLNRLKVVFLGSFFHQIASVGILLALARIFSPKDYALLTLFNSFAVIVPLFITGKFEYAIIAEKENRDAEKAFQLASLLSFFLSPFVGGITYFILLFFKDAIDSPAFFSFLLFVFSLFQAQAMIRNYYLERLYKYKKRAILLLLSTLLSGLIVISLGLFTGVGPYALVLGGILNQLFFVLLFEVYMNYQMPRSSVKEIFLYGRQQKRYPLALIPAGVCYSTATEYRTFATAKYYLPSEVGLLGMYTRIETLAHKLIGTVFSDVFRREASVNYTSGKGNQGFFFKSFLLLFFLGLIPALTFYFLGEDIFSFVLGDKWAEAGRIAQTMSLAFLLTFCASPLSTLLTVTNSQISELIVQSFYFFIVIIGFIIYFSYNKGDFYNFLEVVSWLICSKATLELFLSYRASKKKVGTDVYGQAGDNY